MRFLILSILILQLGVLDTFGQKGPEIGPRMLISFSNLRNNQDRNAAEKIIPTFSNNFGLDLGFTYSMQKSIRSGIMIHSYGKTYIDGNSWIQKKVVYKKIPILFKQITDPRESHMVFSYFIGPQISVLHDAYHYVQNYSSFNEAKEKTAGVTFLKKHSKDYFINYKELYGVNILTPLMYRRTNIDLSFGGGVDYPIRSYLMLSIQIKFDFSILNAELKNKQIFDQKFWTEMWGEEDRRRTGSFSFGPTIALIFIPPKF